MGVRVIADDAENKAGQPGATVRIYSDPMPSMKIFSKRSKSSSIFSYSRKRSCWIAPLGLCSAEEHVVDLSRQWPFNDREIISPRLGFSCCSPSRQPLVVPATSRNLYYDIHDAKKVHVLVPGVELDLTRLTALERRPQDWSKILIGFKSLRII